MLRFLFPYIFFFIFACQVSENQHDVEISPTSQPVKSILLYHNIEGFSQDSIIAVLEDINSVIERVDHRSVGYSLWSVQSDTIDSYRLFIEGEWADQESYDLIHADSSFRRVLDKHLPVLTETRKCDLYRRYEKLKVD